MMPSDDRNAWFRPKAYGFGAGLPIRWQGWALMAVFVAVLLAGNLLPTPLHLLLVAADVALLVIISHRHTPGGWHWRWGGH